MLHSKFWLFLYDHRGVVDYIIGVLSGGILFSLNVWKLWYENKRLKRELEAGERDLEIKSLTEAMVICATYAKQRAGKQDIVFNEQDLRWFLGVHADKVYAVVNALKQQGRARDTNIPGEWAIS